MIAIIGAGISGLSLAYHLEKQGKDYVLLEAKDRPGGVIETIKDHNYILENGPNSLQADENMFDFLEEIGLGDQIVNASDVSGRRLILKKGSYTPLPEKPSEILSSNFFSLRTKLKIITELFRKKGGQDNETIAGFFERRFSKEVVDYAVNPFISGIYAGDPQELLIKETFPKVAEYEDRYGSVLKGLKNNPPARKASVTFKDGMKSLPEAIAGKLSGIQYNSKVEDITFEAGTVRIKVAGEKKDFKADKLVLSVPAFTAGSLLEGFAPDASAAFSKVNYPPMSVIHSVYNEVVVKFNLNGFGVLHPKAENKFTAGTIWSSSVFPVRKKEHEVLFTSFVGGSQHISKARKDEAFTKNKVHAELSKTFRIHGPCLFQHYKRWDKSIPQYDRYISDAKLQAEKLKENNIFICSNWSGGISLPDCIRKGKELAEQL